MISLTDRSSIHATPDQVWAFFADLDARYLEWHPEHLMWRTLSGPPLSEGSIVFADEWIGRFRLTGRFRLSEVQPNALFRWDMLFPYSLIGAGGWFALEPTDDGCVLVAEVHMGWPVPVFGPLLDRLIGVVVPLSDLRRHMREEGGNLARLLAPHDKSRALESAERRGQ